MDRYLFLSFQKKQRHLKRLEIPSGIRSLVMMVLLFNLVLLISNLLPAAILWDSCSYAQEPPPSSVSLMDQGTRLLNEKRLDEAIRAFEDAIVIDPGNPAAYYFAGHAYHLKRDTKNALLKLNKALQLEPGSPQVILEIGVILEEGGRFENAMEAYKAVAGRAEVTPVVEAARERLNKLTAVVHFRAAGKLFQEKKYEESLKELQTVFAITPDNAEAHYAAGLSYQRLGRIKEAMESFKKALDINPRHVDSTMQLALAYESQSAYVESIGLFKKVITLSAGSVQAIEAEKRLRDNEKRLETRRLFESAALKIRSEQWKEALKETMAIIEIEPRNPNALFNLGLIQHNLKAEEEAIDALKKAIEIDPEFQKGYFELAVIYDDLSRTEDALNTYEKVVTLGTKSPEAEKAMERAGILRQIIEAKEKSSSVKELLITKDIEGAIREIEGILLVKKDDPKLYVTLVSLYLQKGRLKEAASAMEKVVLLEPRNTEVRILLAQTYEGLKEDAKAAETYKDAAALEEGTAKGKELMNRAIAIIRRLHFSTGKKFLESGNYEAALREIQAILEVSPDDPVALFNVGVLYNRLNRPEEAEPPLRRVVTLVADYVQAYVQLGLTLESLRNYPGAREAFDKVIELQKEGAEARIARSRIAIIKETEAMSAHMEKGIQLMKQKDWEGARKEMNSIIAANPKNYIGYYYLGTVLSRAGISDEAREAFKKAIAINPSFASSYISLGDLYYKDGEVDEARKVYKEVLNLGTESPEAEIAITRLRGLRPLTGSFSLTHGYNSNIAFGARMQYSLTSNYNLGLRYLLFREKEWSFGTVLGANQSIYYKDQFQGNGYSFGLEWTRKFPGERTLRADLSYNKSYFERLPSFLERKISWEATIEPRAIPTSATFTYLFSRGESYVNKASDADHHNLSLSLSQKVSLRNSIGLSYAFNVQKNLEFLGSNYANRAHTISVSSNSSLWEGAAGSIRYSASFVNYSNPDSITFFQGFRRNVNQSAGTSFNLRLSEKVFFSFNYTYTISRTNLPRPTAEEQRKLQDILSTPIPTVGGGYEQHNVTLSFATSF